MTDAELLANPCFQDACNAWQRDGRAFFGFADVLEEWGLIGEARAWTWAVMEPDRNGWGIGNNGIGGICPRCDSGFHWKWFLRIGGTITTREDLPEDMWDESSEIPGHPRHIVCLSFVEAILFMLRRSADVYGDAGPPRSAQLEASRG